MRQLLGKKKTEKLAKQLGLPIKRILVRGGTDHRMDLCLSGGKVVHLYKDGTMEESIIGWNDNENYMGRQ